MPPVVIPNTARAAIRMQQGGRERVNVLHFNKPGGFSAQDLSDLGSGLVTWWQNFMRPQLPTTLSLVDVTCTNLHDATQEQDVTSCTTNCGGQLSQEVEPGNVTFTTSLRTAFTGRSYRGRSYWPQMTTPQTNGDDTVASYVVLAAGVAIANLIFPGVMPSASLAVASRALHISTVVTGWVIENVLDSQRRRLPGRGV